MNNLPKPKSQLALFATILLANAAQVAPEVDNRKHSHTRDHARPAGRGRTGPKIGRNDPCPCGSGKKFKACCIGKAVIKKLTPRELVKTQLDRAIKNVCGEITATSKVVVVPAES